MSATGSSTVIALKDKPTFPYRYEFELETDLINCPVEYTFESVPATSTGNTSSSSTRRTKTVRRYTLSIHQDPTGEWGCGIGEFTNSLALIFPFYRMLGSTITSFILLFRYILLGSDRCNSLGQRLSDISMV